nr:hypothetical protein MACL_00002017 [Theileria orientalis]
MECKSAVCSILGLGYVDSAGHCREWCSILGKLWYVKSSFRLSKFWFACIKPCVLSCSTAILRGSALGAQLMKPSHDTPIYERELFTVLMSFGINLNFKSTRNFNQRSHNFSNKSHFIIRSWLL